MCFDEEDFKEIKKKYQEEIRLKAKKTEEPKFKWKLKQLITKEKAEKIK
jgi:hypothetical protein